MFYGFKDYKSPNTNHSDPNTVWLLNYLTIKTVVKEIVSMGLQICLDLFKNGQLQVN